MENESNAKLEALGQIEGSAEIGAMNPAQGWMPLDKKNLSYDGTLYPSAYQFQIKPITAGTAKYFSALDENSPIAVNDALTFVVEKHIRIIHEGKLLNTLQTIHEHDRFKLVLLVHLYSGSPTSLSFQGQCTHANCYQEQTIDITAKGLQYSDITAKGLTYLNQETGYFVIATKSMGTRYFRPLSLAESVEIVEFLHTSRAKGDIIEQLFLKHAGFFMHDRKPKETIAELYQRYLSKTSDIKEVSLLQLILEELTIQQSFDLEVTCKSCNNPFQSKITSLQGLRRIFLVRSVEGEL